MAEKQVLSDSFDDEDSITSKTFIDDLIQTSRNNTNTRASLMVPPPHVSQKATIGIPWKVSYSFCFLYFFENFSN